MEEKTPSCKNCEEKSTCVPFFLHENMVMHMSRNNKRMLIALCVVVVGMLILGYMFLSAYTAREKEWQSTIRQLRIAEVADDGVHKQQNP